MYRLSGNRGNNIGHGVFPVTAKMGYLMLCGSRINASHDKGPHFISGVFRCDVSAVYNANLHDREIISTLKIRKLGDDIGPLRKMQSFFSGSSSTLSGVSLSVQFLNRIADSFIDALRGGREFRCCSLVSLVGGYDFFSLFRSAMSVVQLKPGKQDDNKGKDKLDLAVYRCRSQLAQSPIYGSVLCIVAALFICAAGLGALFLLGMTGADRRDYWLVSGSIAESRESRCQAPKSLPFFLSPIIQTR